MSDGRGFLGRLFGRRRRAETPPAPAAAESTMVDLAAADVERLIGSEPALQILDVRFPHEQGPDLSHRIEGAVLIPLPELELRFPELDSGRPTLVYCEHGMRSLNACGFLGQLGFARLYNLSGGMSEYASHRARPKA